MTSGPSQPSSKIKVKLERQKMQWLVGNFLFVKLVSQLGFVAVLLFVFNLFSIMHV